jgi:hypothetical protein
MTGAADQMSASSPSSDALWMLTITCPRPRNRARDDFHTQPDKVSRIAHQWFGPTAVLELTSRTVRFYYASRSCPNDLPFWYEKLATALDCLYLSTRGDDGKYRLPRPVRTEIREDDLHKTSAPAPAQTPPTDGDQVT